MDSCCLLLWPLAGCGIFTSTAVRLHVQSGRSGAPLSGRQKLEPRHSDPLDQTESGGAAEWEREPILNLVTAVLSNCVLGGCWATGCLLVSGMH